MMSSQLNACYLIIKLTCLVITSTQSANSTKSNTKPYVITTTPHATITINSVCKWEKTTLTCEDVKLTENEIIDILAKKTPANLTSLVLRNNNLKSFPVYSLRRFRQLEEFELSDNELTEIPEDILVHAPSLIYLTLNGNKISSLNAIRIAELYGLKKLQLSGNAITEIQAKVFANCSSLMLLSLGNNRINRIYSDSFYGLPNLQNLNLSYNQIATLPSYIFFNMSQLSQLKMDGNLLSSIPILTFNGQEFSYLSFAKNKIKKISINAFYNNNIERMDLSDNQLKTINRFSFRDETMIETLVLSGNPILCDCHFNDFYKSILNDDMLQKINGECTVKSNTSKYDIVQTLKHINCTPCWNVECRDGKECRYNDKGFTKCVCPEYLRYRCDEENPCVQSPCAKWSKCVFSNSQSFKCICPKNYTGQLCKTPVFPTNVITPHNSPSTTPHKTAKKTKERGLNTCWIMFIILCFFFVIFILVMILVFKRYYNINELCNKRERLKDTDYL